MTITKSFVLTLSLLLLCAPLGAQAASPATEAYIDESVQVLGQVFGKHLALITEIRSLAEGNAREARYMKKKCDATGYYVFAKHLKNVYFVQVWNGKAERHRSIELVKGAEATSFELLKPTTAKDKDTRFGIGRVKDAEGKCRYQVTQNP